MGSFIFRCFRLLLVIPASFLVLWHCGRPALPTATPAYTYAFRQLDTLVVAATRIPAEGEAPEREGPPYQPSEPRVMDLLHTALDLHFDWEDETVVGAAILRLTPFRAATDQLRLDAKDMTIHGVRHLDQAPIPYSYDGRTLSLDLDRTYAPGEEISLLVNYSAQPSSSGGSRAIRSDQGLYFIASGPGSPQLWTQGETESNSRWFPTIDQPNERATQEIRLTVPDSLRTLSNGRLVASRPNPNGTRTDHWKLDLPHAPYLAMIAAGPFALVEETRDSLDFQYYVEPDFEADARAIFPHSPDMMAFFSDYFDYPYPWPKYAQIVVREFVSGAMENTTAAVFGDFMLGRKGALVDRRANEKIVAHEMAHHWFGNLLTCESWANLTLNEGFASYGEYLWLEHRYGKEEADLHLQEEREGYFAEAERRQLPLIQYRYRDAEALFDRHRYNKGAAVLHMLRAYLGERTFRRGLRDYLKKNAFRSVEIHDLRLAFEQVTGEDLNWFFDQWFLRPGHPVLDIAYRYDSLGRELVIEVEQSQDRRPGAPIYTLPTSVRLLFPEEPFQEVELVLSRRSQTIRVPCAAPPESVLFDPNAVLLAERRENKSIGMLRSQLLRAPAYPDRLFAYRALADSQALRTPALWSELLADPFWHMRWTAVREAPPEALPPLTESLKRLARSDPHAMVRGEALARLRQSQPPGLAPLATEVLRRDSAYGVLEEALGLLAQADSAEARRVAGAWQDHPHPPLRRQVAAIYAQSGDPGLLSFFETRIPRVQGYAALAFFEHYRMLALHPNVGSDQPNLKPLWTVGMHGPTPVERLAAAEALYDLRKGYRERAGRSPGNAAEKDAARRADRLLREIIEHEQDPDLRSFYEELSQAMEP